MRKLEKKPAKRQRMASIEQRDVANTLRHTRSASSDPATIPSDEDKVERHSPEQRRSPPIEEILSPLSPLSEVAPTEDRPTNSSHYNQPLNPFEVPNQNAQRPDIPGTIHSTTYLGRTDVPVLPSMNVPSSPLFRTRAQPMTYAADVYHKRDSCFPNPFNFQKPGLVSISTAMENRLLPPPYFQASRIEDISFYIHAREAPQITLDHFNNGRNMNRICRLGV